MTSWFSRLLDWEAKWLLHERELSFPLRMDWLELSPLALLGEISKLPANLDFLVPMKLTIGSTTIRTPGMGSVGWLLFQRWRFIAAIEEGFVRGRLQLNMLDRSMALTVVNAWAVMLAIWVVIVVGLVARGDWAALGMLVFVPLLFGWISLVASMYIPLRKRSEASVHAFLGGTQPISVRNG
jgi:hypothetical protein